MAAVAVPQCLSPLEERMAEVVVGVIAMEEAEEAEVVGAEE